MNTELKQATALAALLLTALSLPAAPPVSAADPDLEIESVKLFSSPGGQVNDRVIQYTIVNQGDQDAPKPVARLTITGGKTSFNEDKKEVLLDIPALKANGGSFSGFAGLAGPCDGTIVRLDVSATGEANVANNAFGPAKLCPDLPPPPPAPSSSSGPDENINYGASSPSGPDENINYGACACEPRTFDIAMDDFRGPTTGPRVGFWQWEGQWAFSPLAIHFNSSELRGIKSEKVETATMTFDESPLRWTSGGGGVEHKAGCIGQISILERIDYWDLGVYTRFSKSVVPGARSIDVRPYVQDALQDPDHQAKGFTWMLRGTADYLEGTDETSCLSNLSNVVLHIRVLP
jgi:hypothetical protein